MESQRRPAGSLIDDDVRSTVSPFVSFLERNCRRRSPAVFGHTLIVEALTVKVAPWSCPVAVVMNPLPEVCR
jgi:hypothetical protein